jgi:hypothetical protein
MAIGLLNEQHVKALRSVAERLAARGLAQESAELRRVLDEVEHPPRYLDAATAGEILTMPERVVRNWVRAGLVPGKQDEAGNCFVERAALQSAIEMRETLPDYTGPELPDEVIDAEIAAVRAERRARAGRR